MARQLGVDPLTIKRHAYRLGLPFPRPKRIGSQLRENQRLRPHCSKRQTPLPGRHIEHHGYILFGQTLGLVLLNYAV